MNEHKASKILRKLGFTKRDNKGKIPTMRKISEPTFRALALRESKLRDFGLLVVYVGDGEEPTIPAEALEIIRLKQHHDI